MSVISEITTELADYLNETICPSIPIDVETDLLAAGIVDSLLIMELVEHIHSTYGISVESAAIVPRNFRSVQTLGDLIVSRLETFSVASNL